MKRVLFFDHTAKWSGGEIALYRTLSALDTTQYEPLLLLSEEGPFGKKSQEIGVKTQILPLNNGLGELRKDTLGSSGISQKLSAVSGFLRYAISVARFAREQRADLIHCNSLKSDIIGAIAGRLSRTKVLWHVRDHINPSYLPARTTAVFRNLAKRLPDAVIVNSQSTGEELFPSCADLETVRCFVAYDGLMQSELSALMPLAFSKWRSPQVKIGLLGRLVRWKGQHVFIEAARLLMERKIDAQFQIIGSALFGESDYEAEIRSLAAPLGARVAFLGFRSDVPELLRQLDILAHCSISGEPFGQVVVEGMAEGLPVVASDGGGVREIIRNEVDGLRTPMGDAAALADALARLIACPEYASQLGQMGHTRVRVNFTAEQSARAVESVYARLFEKNKRV
jgi:glycosyltransferase involved in cell wall biosynthesis